MMRTKGHPDDRKRKIKSFSINLETWLIDCIRERDPNLLKDTKWMYRNLWHELIRQMQVCSFSLEILEKYKTNVSQEFSELKLFISKTPIFIMAVSTWPDLKIRHHEMSNRVKTTAYALVIGSLNQKFFHDQPLL